jgi:hypothetical protein
MDIYKCPFSIWASPYGFSEAKSTFLTFEERDPAKKT